MSTTLNATEIEVGKCLSEDLKYHLKKYLNSSDYGYVSHMHNNSPSPGTIDRIFRNEKPIPVSENSLPAIKDLMELALTRIEEEAKDAKVSKQKIEAALK